MELPKSTHVKIQVSRNLKRRTREGIETLALNVETILPTKDTSQGSFAELEASIRRILTGLNEVAPVSANPPISNPAPSAASSNPQTTDEYHTAIMTPEGVALAQLSLQENTLQVSVVEGRRD